MALERGLFTPWLMRLAWGRRSYAPKLQISILAAAHLDASTWSTTSRHRSNCCIRIFAQSGDTWKTAVGLASRFGYLSPGFRRFRETSPNIERVANRRSPARV